MALVRVDAAFSYTRRVVGGLDNRNDLGNGNAVAMNDELGGLVLGLICGIIINFCAFGLLHS